MSDVAASTLSLPGLLENPVPLKPAELLALSGFTEISGHNETQKLLGDFKPMCVCERLLLSYSLSENQENPEKARNSAGFRVSGLSIISKTNTVTLGVFP